MNAHNFAHVCLTAQWWIPPDQNFLNFQKFLQNRMLALPLRRLLDPPLQ